MHATSRRILAALIVLTTTSFSLADTCFDLFRLPTSFEEAVGPVDEYGASLDQDSEALATEYQITDDPADYDARTSEGVAEKGRPSLKAEDVPVAPHSFAALYPDSLADFQRIKNAMPSVRDFNQTYFQKNGRAPTLVEVAQYFYDHSDQMTSLAKEAESHQRAQGHLFLAHYFATAAKALRVSKETRAKLRSRVESHPGEFQAPFDFKNSNHREFVRSINSRNLGEMGELEYALKLDYVLLQGLKFGDHIPVGHAETIETRDVFKEKFAELEEHPERLAEWEAEYPYVFSHKMPVQGEELGSESERRLHQAELWIESKEIDIITEDPQSHQITWVEVKNLGHPMTLAGLVAHNGKKKSYLDQLLETLQLRNFLGLQNKVQIKAAYRAGLTREVKLKLESIGVTAIGTVID